MNCFWDARVNKLEKALLLSAEKHRKVQSIRTMLLLLFCVQEVEYDVEKTHAARAWCDILNRK